MDKYVSRDDVRRFIADAFSENRFATNYDYAILVDKIDELPATEVQPIDDDNGHIIYIGRKAYLAENTIMEFMKKMDIIRDSLAYIENYFDTYAETIRQINACSGRCTNITEVKYFIDRIKENSGYD